MVLITQVQSWRTQQDQIEKFRARLRQVPRFEPKRLANTKPRNVPMRQMEYHRQEARVQERPDLVAPDQDIPLLSPPELARVLRPFAIAAKADTFSPEVSERQAERAMASTEALRDSLRGESLDLLRVQDLAAAGNLPAVVLIGPTNRRDVTGFVTLRRVRLRGAGGGTRGLEALARHMRDHTQLLVQVDPRKHDYFLNPELLRDPIHFLFGGGGLRLSGDWPLLQVGEREKEMLRQYVQGGGLLFIEGSNRFLQSAAQLMQEVVGADGGMRPLPPTHPVYHAFFDFDSGFPSEDKGIYFMLESRPTTWDYPIRAPDEVVEAAPNVNPDLEEIAQPAQPPAGLWGVELEGRLVAILSDIRLHDAWVGSMALNENTALDLQSGPKLAAGVNLIVYALTREEGTAVRRALPAWVQKRPVDRPSAAIDDTSSRADPDAGFDESLYDHLDGAVAVVCAPLGASFGPGSVRIRVGGHDVELFRDDLQGVILNQLPPGEHWVEIAWRGKSETALATVKGRQISTVTLSVQRLAMLHRILVEVQPDVVGYDDWLHTFDDLEVQEIFLEGVELFEE